VINIGPGTFTEPAITVGSYISLEGAGVSATVITPGSNLFTVITLSDHTSARGFTIAGLSGTVDEGVFIDGGDETFAENIIIKDVSSCLRVIASAGVSDVAINNIICKGYFVSGLFVDGTVATGSNSCKVNGSRLIFECTASATSAARIAGPLAEVDFSNLYVSDCAGDGVVIEDGSFVFQGLILATQRY
jgi:hypothetical protein